MWSAAAVVAATAAGRLFVGLVPLPNSSMIFLMAVLFSAVSFGMWPAVFASALSFLAYNYFLIDPRYTLQIAQAHELLAVVTFLIVAIVTSALAGRVRDQALRAGERARAMRRLYEFTWRLSGFTVVHDVAGGAAAEIHTSLRRPVMIFLGNGDDLALAAAWPPDDKVDPAVLAAAKRVDGEARFEPRTGDGGWQFLPLRTKGGSIGVVAIAPDAGEPLDGEARALLAILTEQTAAAIERAALARDMAATQEQAETERVRNILLTSISHDFRTPLASILGSATSLIEFRHTLGEGDQVSLLRDIKAEAEGLDDMVKNLLAMTRIDAGALELRRDWVDLREVAGRVVSAARRRGADLSFVIELPAELPMIAADALLVEQALANVVGNAVAHTPTGSRVTIDAVAGPDTVALRVTDDGPGIPADTLANVFDKFVRAPAKPHADRGSGSGLGLAIAKGIAVAHGGAVDAQSPVADGRGTRITLTFPREAR